MLSEERAWAPPAAAARVSAPALSTAIGFLVTLVPLFFWDYLVYGVGLSIPRGPTLLIGLGFVTLGLLVGERIRTGFDVKGLAFFALLCALFEMFIPLRGFPVEHLNFFIGPLVAIVLVLTCGDWMRQFALGLLCLNVLLQGWEYATGGYLFVGQSIYDQSLLDENLFAGGGTLLRTKGLFPGPLSAAGFAVLTVAWWPRSVAVAAIGLLCALLAHGRLGMVMIGVMLLYAVLATSRSERTQSLSKSRLIVGVSAVALLVLAVGPLILGQEGLERFRLGFVWNDGSSTNISRLYYWTLAIQVIRSFDLTSWLLGSPGLIESMEGSSAVESSVLRTVLDTGLAGLALTVISAGVLARKAFRVGRLRPLHVALIAVAALMFPLLDSLPLNVTTWALLIDSARRAESSD